MNLILILGGGQKVYINTTIKEENINLNYDYSYQNEKVITPFAFFPQKNYLNYFLT